MTSKQTKPVLHVPMMALRIELLVRRAIDRDDAIVAKRWYSDALDFCTDIASDLRLPVSLIVGFVAAMSPRNSWASQLRHTRKQVTAAILGKDASAIPFAGTNANKRKAFDIANGIRPAVGPNGALGGPKVLAFYDAILSGGKGNGPAVIDVHAFAACSANFSGAFGLPDYRKCAEAFAIAASVLRMTVHECQALAWVEHRKLPLEAKGAVPVYVWGDNDRAKRAGKGNK